MCVVRSEVRKITNLEIFMLTSIELESFLRSKQVLIKFQVGKFPIKLEIIQLHWEFSNFNESFPTWMLTFQLIDIFNKKQPPFPVRK